MEVLTSLSPKIFGRNGGRTLSSAQSALPRRSDIGFPHLKKLHFDSLVLSSGKPVRSIAKSHLISNAKVLTDFDGVMHGVEDIKPSETVRVKFKLEKKCKFGEQFLLVGDDSMLGFWNPSCAIPMNWSAGDVWTAELDIPIETTLQFKFILRDIKGEMSWQPGADRILKTWSCENTIVVTEAWENAEAQKITEESLLHRIEDQSIISDFDKIGVNVNYEVVTTIGSTNNPMAENMNNTDKEMIAEAYAALRKEEAMHSNNNPSSLYGTNLVTMEDEKYLKYGEGC